MSIDNIGSSGIHPRRPTDAKARGSDSSAKQETPSRSTRGDRVEISDRGLQLSGLGSEAGQERKAASLEEVAARVEQGFYDRDPVAGRVAQRLYSSGDLNL